MKEEILFNFPIMYEDLVGYQLEYLLTDEIIKDKTPIILGIDEAGRGPVLGPMVYGCAFCPLDQKNELKDMGFVDSKTVKAHESRLALFETLKNSKDVPIGYIIRVLDPELISNKMLDISRESLNEMSHNCAIEMIKYALSKDINVTEVYVDTIGDPKKYQAKLSEIFPTLSIVVSKKADSIYPIVSAASICAKVTRDLILTNWKFKEKKEFPKDYGSGYTSDPYTIKWLKNNVDKVFGYPSIVRFSWETTSVALKKAAYEVKWDEDDEDIAYGLKQKKLNFVQRHSFFSDNCLEPVDNF